MKNAVRGIGLSVLALVFYTGAVLGGMMLLNDSVLAACVGAFAALLFAIVWRHFRARKGDTTVIPNANPIPKDFLGLIIFGFILVFLVGQAAAQWWLLSIGSPTYESSQGDISRAPVLVVMALTLFLAPIGEEALLRGTMYPAMRWAFPSWLAAVITSTLFAVLHGNMVQIIATLPLAILSAALYEATHRMAPSMLLHAVFNAIAVFIPIFLIEPFISPFIWGPGAVLLILVFYKIYKDMPPYAPKTKKVKEKYINSSPLTEGDGSGTHPRTSASE